MPENPDLCLVLGGDGSILWALRQYAGTEVPVFGINFGTIGFLAAAERRQLDEALGTAFAGDFEVLALPGLEARRRGTGGIAFNDVSFSRRPHGRVAELSYRIAGQEVGQRALRRARRRDPDGVDRLQPRQRRPDPRLGGGGIRGQLHRPPHAHREGAGGRPR